MATVSLTEEQYEKTRKFIQEQRGTFMVAFYFFLGATLLLLPLAAIEFQLDLDPVHSGGRRYSAAGYLLGAALMLIVLLIRGLGRIFGPRSDYDCIRRSEYGCQYFTVRSKDANKNKHPYFVTDAQGFDYICVSFLDYKYAEPGTEMIGITLGNGKRYAIQCYDAADPYARLQS